MATPAELLAIFRDEYLPNAQGATVSFAGWKKGYPAEYTAWVVYRDAVLAGNLPQPPTMTSKYGKALAAAGQMAERDDMKVTLSTSGGTANLEGTVTVSASAVPASQVTKIEIYVDDVLKTTDTSSPYTYSWDTTAVATGAHQLKARAFYPRNKVAEVRLDVTVLSQVEPPPQPPPSPQGAPVNTSVPTITGTATEGQTLTVLNGSWTNSPTSYSRQWIRCDAAGANPVPISSATGSSYVLTAADVGATIRCAVTAYNSIGPSAVATTAQTGVVASLAPAVPVNSVVPSITGTPAQGNVLSTSNGSWTNSPTSYTYQWKRCNSSGASCVNISGATAQTYTLIASDVGATIRSAVTAVNASGSSTVAQSAVSAVVTAPPVPPPSSSTPEAPRSPITVITDAAIGLNINNQPSGSVWDDYDIIRTSDSGCIMQGTGSGHVLRRYRMRGIGQNTPHPGYGVHGIYCKIPNSILEDLDIEVSDVSADNHTGLTLRRSGIVVDRARIVTPEEIISYYEEVATVGTVTIRNVIGTGGSAFWASTNGQSLVRQAFVFENCHFTGGSLFATCAAGKYAGAGITITGCTQNGSPVTAGMVSGFSPVTIN